MSARCSATTAATFSLPGLRPRELLWLLDRLELSTAHPASGLLLVPMCYLSGPDDLPIDRLAKLCVRIPGARKELARAIAANMRDHLVVPDNRWQLRPDFGSCSTWSYSQRNPQSALSERDFKFIESFFSEVRDD